MKKDRYVAYVGTYTHGESLGIHLYDLDVEKGEMKERKVIPVSNPSHLTKAHNGKFLYSIADEGVEAFRILPDGDLEVVNKTGIKGMRGCYVATDSQDRFLFVAGYHDGKVTVLRLMEDGSVGEITENIFHKGLGSVAERNFRPHINCVMLTPEEKYLCAVNNGTDQISIYRVDYRTGKLDLVDVLRCELESAPRLIKFSQDGRFAYVIHELKNYISVYTYEDGKNAPIFEEIQRIDTTSETRKIACAASGMKFSPDGKYLYTSSAGDNCASIFEIDQETGKLTLNCRLPINGNYPKDLDIFPDQKTLISLNHESNHISLFRVYYDEHYFTVKGKEIKVETPNCVVISKVD